MSIVLATVLGFVIGVGRVSNNWVINRLSRAYVEFIRNVPLVVQLVWWYALFLSLPAVRNSIQIADNVYLSNRGLAIPHLSLEGWGGYVFLVLLASCFTAFMHRRSIINKVQWTGFHPVLWPRLLAIVVVPPFLVVLAALVSGHLEFSTPKLTGFNFGGMIVIPELVALWVALSVYSASYIAEIVRGCIQSISKGQHEAGKALGFSEPSIMWKLIVPQAVYPMIPQITSVYLNIIKNSFCWVCVIGFMELVSSTGGTTLNNTGQAIECILIVIELRIWFGHEFTDELVQLARCDGEMIMQSENIMEYIEPSGQPITIKSSWEYLVPNQNLFSSALNTVLTVVGLLFVLWLVPTLLNWFIFNATFAGSSQADCTSSGACWLPVVSRIELFTYGMYPDDRQWRVDVCFRLGSYCYSACYISSVLTSW
ncbi:ABC transporter permease subunit [Vibrio sp. M60_M31a]